MKQLKVVLVDDEASARNVLSKLITRLDPELQIMGCAKHLEEGVEMIKKYQPDIVFLDFEMPNYAGYEIVNFFDQIRFKIIFVTAYDKYALKAFELSAIDYLLKPIDRTRLEQAIDKAKQQIQGEENIQAYKALQSSIQNRLIEKIVIPELGGKKVIELKELVAFEADGAYTKLHMEDEQIHIVSKHLKFFEEQLNEDERFFRAHKSWIININFIVNYNSKDALISLKGNVNAKLSRYRKEEFVKNLSE